MWQEEEEDRNASTDQQRSVCGTVDEGQESLLCAVICRNVPSMDPDIGHLDDFGMISFVSLG